MTQDIIIVGAGIAGMWAAHQLHAAGRKILVLEAESHAGGRIATHHENKHVFELGPSRITPSMHPQLFQALEVLGYTSDDLASSGGGLTYSLRKAHVEGTSKESPAALYALTSKERKLATKFQPPELLRHVLEKVAKQATTELTFTEYLQKIGWSEEMVRYLRDSFGYNSDFDVMNAVDAVQELTRWTSPHIKFFGLKPGLDSIIQRIRQKLPEEIVRFNTPVTSLQMNDGLWTVTSGATTFQTRQLVLALPKQALAKLIAANFLQFSEPQPLVRLFIYFDQPWFKDLPRATVSSGPIRFLFGISDTVMQIYIEGPYATYWQTLLEASGKPSEFAGTQTWDLTFKESSSVILTEVRSALANLFPQYKDKITPTRVLAHACWTHYWLKGADSKQIIEDTTSNLLKHDPSLPPLYVCGEAFSRTQGWMEGAIETANLVVASLSASKS